MLGLIGKKMGMTQVFADDGTQIPVTVVEAGPCTVVQRKTKETDGYDAVQLGFGKVKPKRVIKALQKHFEKKNLELFRHLREFRTDEASAFEVGRTFTVETFEVGDVVDVVGVTKGKGFQGVIKRHGKHGGPMSHGSDFHRRTGSIGMRTWPARVFKNTRLPGHMGVDRVTIKNLKVVGVRPEENVLLIKGALPGAKNGLLLVVNRTEGFEKRDGITAKAEKAQVAEKVEKNEKAETAEKVEKAEK